MPIFSLIFRGFEYVVKPQQLRRAVACPIRHSIVFIRFIAMPLHFIE